MPPLEVYVHRRLVLERLRAGDELRKLLFNERNRNSRSGPEMSSGGFLGTVRRKERILGGGALNRTAQITCLSSKAHINEDSKEEQKNFVGDIHLSFTAAHRTIAPPTTGTCPCELPADPCSSRAQAAHSPHLVHFPPILAGSFVNPNKPTPLCLA
jgi:hypothetical protein